jgi:outer membrane receptor protein involved in Fe transport
MRVFLSSLVCWVFLLAAASVARAQPAVPRELLLFRTVPVVVTPTRREQPLTRAPSAITVITAEEIRQSGATSLPELLRSVPGLDFFRTSASSVNIAARGLNRDDLSKIQVLVDGLSVYEDVLNLIFWHQIPVPLEEIQRIEIVRSPATALYGDKAFGGVIHIITKSPEVLQGTHVSGTVGEADTRIGNLIHAGVVDNLSYKVSIGYDRTNQFPNPGAVFARTSADLGREDIRGHFQVNYHLAGASQVSLSGGIDEFARREVFTAFSSLEVVSGGLGFVKANYTLGDFKVQLSYNRFDADVSALQRFPQETSVRANVYQAQLQHSLALGQHVLTGGTTYRFVAADSPGFIGGQQDQHLLACFLQDEWNIHENLALTVGVGVDVHPEAGVSASPRGSLVYSPWKDHTFRFSIAKSFRNPSFLENFAALPLKEPPTALPRPPTLILLGNTELQPEELLSYELGYQTLLFGRLRVRLELFYNQFDRLMVLGMPRLATPNPLLPSIGTQQFINGGDGESVGGEVGFDAFITPWLTGFLNYSYQDRKPDVLIPDPAPHHKGNAGLTASFTNGLSATVLVHYVGEPEAPGRKQGLSPYTLVNLRRGSRFKLFGNEMEAAIQAFNLFNDVHREINGGDLIERRVSGTLRYRL